MTNPELVQRRLHNQQLAQQAFTKPEEVVGWMGAVQAQDYEGGKWAVAQRAQGLTNTALDAALAQGTILRTHVMRSTWHFVTPADIRWMLALTAPRINALLATPYRQLELDAATLKKSRAALSKALRGGKQLTRAELHLVFRQADLDTTNLLRFGHLIGNAELEGLVCSGGRRGKQFTYALLDERAPHGKTLSREEALGELATRYFTSHGPATLKDYVWWSGLRTADAKHGIELVESKFIHETIEGKTYWFAASAAPTKSAVPFAHLLPNYDEYIVGYTDRSAMYDPQHKSKLDARANPLFNHTIALNGNIVGTWKRTVTRRAVIVEPNFFVPLNKAQTQAVLNAANRYSAFLELPLEWRAA